MPILDELKKMYVKLGGKVDQDHSYENTSEILDAMGDIIQSTIELPGVTSDDNGKVLKVVDGSWDKGDEGGLPQVDTSDEGKVLAVNSSGEWDKENAPTELPSVTASDSGKILSVNSSGEWYKGDAPSNVDLYEITNSAQFPLLKNGKTVKDIADSINSGKTVVLKQEYRYYYLVSYNATKGTNHKIRFAGLSSTDNFDSNYEITALIMSFENDTNDTFYIRNFSIYKPILPEVSSGDAGKILTVNSGGKWEAQYPS